MLSFANMAKWAQQKAESINSFRFSRLQEALKIELENLSHVHKKNSLTKKFLEKIYLEQLTPYKVINEVVLGLFN